MRFLTRLPSAPGQLATALSAPFRSMRAKNGATPRRRAVAIAALCATFAVVASGTAVFAAANKTITVDVDGVSTQVTTYAGSVEGLLDDRSIDVGARDTVAPAADTALLDGAEIVVRHANLVKVKVDGVTSDVWTTALSADEALETLASRGGDVRLVVSRSASGGRNELPIVLTDGPVDVKVDGKVLTADGSRGIAAALKELKITLSVLDRVSVRHAPNGDVTLVVQRVVVQDVAETQPIAFTSSEAPDPALFEGKTAVGTAGVAGVRTIVNIVTTIDGKETARKLRSDAVTTAPVNEVIAVGTKVRPVVVAAPPAPAAPATAAAPSAPANPNVGGGADSLNWPALAACESGGNPTIVSSNGLYHGLYQFSMQTWATVGGSGAPSAASADEQTMRAKMLYNRSGAGQWPHCGPRLFS